MRFCGPGPELGVSFEVGGASIFDMGLFFSPSVVYLRGFLYLFRTNLIINRFFPVINLISSLLLVLPSVKINRVSLAYFR